MIYEYKLACIEAGLSDEQIKEIEQVFDTEYKAVQYDQTKREKYQVEILHIEGMVGPDGEVGSYEPEDYSTNIWIYRCAESACPVFWKSPVQKEEIAVPDRR